MQIKCSETLGIIILLIGIALLLTTFIIASIHLQGDIIVLPVPRLLSSFGSAFSPLIDATIRVIYLGLMGWIATTVTVKGLNILLQAKRMNKYRLNS